MRRCPAWWIALAAGVLAAFGPACSHDWSAAGDDGDDGVQVEDGSGETGDDADVGAETESGEGSGADSDAEAESEAGSDEGSDSDVDTDVAIDAIDTGPSVCGNGMLEGREVCDDGNTTNEECNTDSASACLGDCTLLQLTCGNGHLEAGEECDDGNVDSMDDCTTSCTVNYHDIGDPCRCTAGCSDLDPTAGTIVGCEHVVLPPGGSAELACLRTVTWSPTGLAVHAAEGYCTLMAVACEGSGGICGIIPESGSVTGFTCPPETQVDTITATVFGANVTIKSCLEICATQSACRWNAVDSGGTCGQYQCIFEAGAAVGACSDPRT
jgi:cysteine-rich repeat protein